MAPAACISVFYLPASFLPLLQVAQSLLDTALQPPLQNMTARQLYQLLQAAAELGAAPNAQQLQLVQTFLQP